MEKIKNKDSLWVLTLSPLIWVVYFLLLYITVTIWCAKAGRYAGLNGMRVVIAFYTVVALSLVSIQIIKSYRCHKKRGTELLHDDDTPEDRERFLGFANFLISSLSALAILFLAFNAVIFRSCN